MPPWDDREPWHIGDRWYLVTGISQVGSDEGFGLELEDVGPTLGRGVVMRAFRDNSTGQITITCPTDKQLPIELVEQFSAETRLRTSPVGSP
jgi:hypothetical protein